MDDLDRINALCDARGWEDHYLVELLLEFVSKRNLRADLLAHLQRAAKDEDNMLGYSVKTP